LPVVKRKRMLLDSLRRSRKVIENQIPISDKKLNSSIPNFNIGTDSVKQKKKIAPKPIEPANPEKPIISRDSIINADKKKLVVYNNKLKFFYV